MKTSYLLPLFLLILLEMTIPCSGQERVIKNDTRNQSIVFGNSKIIITVNYQKQCRITSLEVNGQNVTENTSGVFSKIRPINKTYTTLKLNASPKVYHTASSVKISGIIYGDVGLPVTEEWIFEITADDIRLNIARTYPKSFYAEEVSFPSFNFSSINTWEGAFLESGGLAWFYLFTGQKFTYGVHSDYAAFWNSKTGNGLKIGVSSPGKEVAGRFTRSELDQLVYEVTVSDNEMIPRYDPGTHRRRFIRGSSDVWSGFMIPAGTASQTITLTPFDYYKEYNRGKFEGIDGSRVTSVINTIARIGVIDAKHFGGNSWHTPYGPLCLHEQYIAQFGIGINDERYLNGYRECLDYYRDHAIRPDGRVISRWAYDNSDAMAGTVSPKGFYEAQWGYLMDSNPDFVINVAELYDQCGDLDWVAGHQRSCERALDFMLRRDSNGNNLVEMMSDYHTDKKGSDWIDIMWASFENAFVNAKMYRALVLWSDIERQLGNPAKASYYSDYAEKMKASFNKSTQLGGFWDEEKQCYIHWRDKDNSIHGNNLVTPVNFMAIAYGICDDTVRSRAILDQIENQMQKEKLFFWPICIYPYQPDEGLGYQFPFPIYENGDIFLSWGSVAVQAYAGYKPELALKYVKNVLDRHSVDGLAFQRYGRLKQDGLGDDILSGNSMAVVGLYQAIYGVNPLYNRIYLDPHITDDLAGTELIYHFRGDTLTIGLNKNLNTISNGQFKIFSSSDFGFFARNDEVEFFKGREDSRSMLARVGNGMNLNLNIISWEKDDYRWDQASGTGGGKVKYQMSGFNAGKDYTVFADGKKVDEIGCSQSGILEFELDVNQQSTQVYVSMSIYTPDYDLRPLFEQYGLTVRDQGGRGTCSVFAIVGLMEFEYAHLLGEKVNLSVEYLNWASNKVTGVVEDGSFFSDALKGLHAFGICEDSLFPYYIRNFTKKVEPSATALADGKKRRKAEIVWIKQWDPECGMSEDQILQVKAQIRDSHPVAIGFQWPKGEERFRRMEKGMMTVPPREGVFDGHSIILVGYKDDPAAPGGGWFSFRNSHGTGYGDGGYGRMPYEYVRKYANDGVTLKVGGSARKNGRSPAAER